jgi:hypothetical protein
MTSPYSPYSPSIVVITDALIAKLESPPALTFTLAPTAVFFGDQDRIPSTPAVCVEPGEKNRTLNGAGQMTDNEFEIYILVYHNKVQGNETTRRECDILAYEIEKYLHTDLQLLVGGSDPRLIHGFVRSNESGYTFKQNTLYRSARLTYYGRNKTSLTTT